MASSSVKQIIDPPATDLLVSVCGALAGLVITAAYRNSVIAGALVAMRLIDAASAVGVALAAGTPEVAAQALQRLGLDAALIAMAGVLVVFIKQRFTHKRAPLH